MPGVVPLPMDETRLFHSDHMHVPQSRYSWVQAARDGEERSVKLSEFSSKVYKDCKIRGRLINLPGGYPGLISGDGSVVGEIHHTPKIQNALKKLDMIEGFKGYGEDGSLFHRVLTYSNDIPCWTYVYARSPDDGPVIESGDWLKR